MNKSTITNALLWMYNGVQNLIINLFKCFLLLPVILSEINTCNIPTKVPCHPLNFGTAADIFIKMESRNRIVAMHY